MSTEDKPRKIEFAENSRPRFRDVPLEFPLLVEGKKLEIITVKRMKASEIKTLQELMNGDGFRFENMLSVFTDQPQDVLDALDQDDITEVAETVLDFLPVRMRQEMQDAEAQMEQMMEQRLAQDDASKDSEVSTLGDSSSAKSPTPSSGEETSS